MHEIKPVHPRPCTHTHSDHAQKKKKDAPNMKVNLTCGEKEILYAVHTHFMLQDEFTDFMK